MKSNRRTYEITKKVLGYIKEKDLICPGDHVIVALSGGTDSVCLFYLLLQLRDEIGFSVSATHIHHGIRQETADRDVRFVKELCEGKSVPITIIYEDIPSKVMETGESVEECARRIRYEYFRKESEKYDKSLIAVAHHIDDQAETVMFRMIRGTGIKGLKAMRSKNGDIIRPLLCLTREEILEYLTINNIDYCTDETNDSLEYSRNGIRHLVMPELDKICHQASVHIADVADEAALIDAYLDKKAEELYAKSLVNSDDNIKLNVSTLTADDQIIVSRVIRIAIGNSIKSLKDVTREHVKAVVEILSKDKSSSVTLPKGLTVIKEGNELIFTEGYDQHNKEEINIKVNIPGVTYLPGGKVLECILEDKPEGFVPTRNLYTKCVDYDKIKLDLCIRTRGEGDFLVADAKGSRKSISRYMIDEKIPKSERDNILLMASENEVYWVIGYRISESIKVTEETATIAKMILKETNEQ